MKKAYFRRLFALVSVLAAGLTANALGQSGGVYQIGTPEDLAAFADLVNSGENKIDATLTADIDFTGYTDKQIGTASFSYNGTFDGQGHKVTLNYQTRDDYTALFRYFGSSGTVKNLITDGTVTTSMRYVGGIAAEGWGKILNCASYITIKCGYDGDGTNGGIIGRSHSATVDFCLSAVKITGERTTHCGGIIGWQDDTSTVKNTLCVAEFQLAPGDDDSDAIARNNGVLSSASGNVYFVNAVNHYNENYCTQVTLDQLASGEICYRLNGNQQNIVWHQTIGEDPYPVPFPTSQQVYAVGKLNCVGQSIDGSELTYSNTNSTPIPDHNYVNGICADCGKANPTAFEQKDGFYQIGSPEALAWFASMVNSGNSSISAQLTADIDFTGYPSAFIGNVTDQFNGTFDGQGHRITYALVRNTVYAAPFLIGPSGVVKNLIIDGTITTTDQCAGGIASLLYGRVENCATFINIHTSKEGDGTSGGVCARTYDGSVIESCLVATKFLGGVTTNCGGVIGWMDGKCSINNTLCISEIELSPSEGSDGYRSDNFARNYTNMVSSSNNYYLNIFNEFDVSHSSCTQVTEDMLASGEIAYLLNGDQSKIRWYQTIGEDAYPTPFPTSKQVYAIGDLACNGKSLYGTPLTYTNSGGSPLPDHKYVGGVCAVCGAADPNACQEVDGYYQISTADHLAWFAAKVNSGDNKINAQLTADIDMTNFPSSQIGSEATPFEGTFDGQGHKVTLNIETDQDYAGMFRYLGSNGAVRNLTTDGNITTTQRYVGGIAGNSNGRIQNCVSLVTINSSYSGDNTTGGIVGRSSGSLIEYTLAATKIIAPMGANCGGIAGWLDGGTTFKNCVVITDIQLGDYNDTDAVTRNNGTMTDASGNNYFLNAYSSHNDNYCKQISMEQVESGELCILINSKLSEPHWFQRIDEDKYPTPNPERGIVYKVNKTYGNAYDAESFAEFRSKVLTLEQEYCENVVAQKSLVEAYAAMLPTLGTCNDIESLVNTFNENIKELCDAVNQSEKAYTTYQNKINETLAYLEANPDLSNAKVDDLMNYLTEADEPSETFTHGTAPYILEEGLLNENEILDETSKIDEMLLETILYSPTPGTNITKLLTNPDFADGFNGWKGKVGTGTSASPDNSWHAGEVWSNTMDMYQTLTNLQNGVYELQVNGAFRPYPEADHFNTNYGATLYANDMHNFFQTNIEDMISADEAQDGVNCHLTGENPDLVISDIDGNVLGYTMYGMISCCNAFYAGRYFNSVLVNVTDGTLKVGIKQPGFNHSNEWLGFGNVQVIYHGTIEEATDGLNSTLESMIARANTLLDYEPNFGEDYALYPNFSQALKDQLKETVEAAEAASDNETKYKLIETFSSIFQEVYDCKLAYIGLMQQAITLADLSAEFADAISEEQATELANLAEYVANGYAEGYISTEEAKKNFVSELSFMPKTVDGVYQIASKEDMFFYAFVVNGGNNTANAILTADIDLTAYPTLEIGTASIGYNGTFDGQGHKITLGIVREGGTEYAALFRNVGSNGVIKNLITDGTITTDGQEAGGISGQLSGHILNCATYVTINTSVAGDGTHGGITSRTLDGSSIEFCLSAVRMVSDVTTNCGGVVGWMDGKCVIKNTLCIAELNFTNLDSDGYYSDSFCRNSGNMTAGSGNNYFLNLYHDYNKSYCTQITAEQLISGEVCFLLNGNQEVINWYQTLGEDATPLPFATSKQVYAVGNLNCKGESADGSPLTYSNTNSTPMPDHSYVDGICSVCGKINPNACPEKDGFFQIGTAAELAWFAALTNQVNNSANAQLTADIDFTGYHSTQIGTSDFNFNGTFDGQGHKVTLALDVYSDYVGIIRYLGSNGTVKNLITDGTITTTERYAGGIAGNSNGKIQNCASYITINSSYPGDNTTGGIVGRSNGSVIENTLSATTIIAPKGTNCGGIIGWMDGMSTIKNCLAITDIQLEDYNDTDAITRNNGQMSDASGNNYFLNAYSSYNKSYCKQVTQEQLASGEIAYLLNGDQSEINWYQTIGKDAHPIPFPTSGIVGLDENGLYSNTAVKSIASDKVSYEGIYNLLGQKLQKTVKGINIVNGKKVLVK